MSFGASPSDVSIVAAFCKALYRKCEDAGGEYDEISSEVRGLHTVLRDLRLEVEDPESPLKRDHSIWSRQLAPIIGNCNYTLHQLDGLLKKYGRLNSAKSATSSRPSWDKVRLGSDEMDTLGEIRVKLISQKRNLAQSLDTIDSHQYAEMSQTLDHQNGQLDAILDKVDELAARTEDEKTIWPTYGDMDKMAWKQFRQELITEGFSKEVLEKHKESLRAYIREIDQKGQLDYAAPHVHTPSHSSITPEHRLDAVRSGRDDLPPSFSSLGSPVDDGGTKSLVFQEENMKFPASMKLQRPKPESRREEATTEASGQLAPYKSQHRRASGASRRGVSPVPRLITSSDEKDEKAILYYNTSGSDSETDSESSMKRSRRPEMGLVIRTSDLLAPSQALALHPASPSSFRSRNSFGEDDVVRSMAQRPRKQIESSTSPLQIAGMPIPAPTNLKRSLDNLAPDEHGNSIPADAQWTRINRRLVSPEVLHQDGRRYEARPDFVAVLGVLSRAEIESLASRSHALRTARQRSHSMPHSEPHPPQQPPRPTTLPIPVPMPIHMSTARAAYTPHHRSGRDTPSSSGSESEDSFDDHIRDRSVGRRRSKTPRTYAGSNIGVPVSGYPNPFGSPLPPSPLFSGPSSHGDRDYGRDRDMHRGDHERREKERDRDRGERRRHSSRSSHTTHTRPKEKEKVAPAQRSKWKDHLTAAGIGGAAASLVNVLTEAAEGL